MPRIDAATVAEHRALTRQRILDAFARLTRERGIAEVSLAQVATAAGLARSALYNYFPDKTALMVAFTEQITDRFLELYRAKLTPRARAVDRIAAFIRVQLEGLAAHPHPVAAELGATLGPDAYQELADHVAPMTDVLKDVIREGVEAGELLNADADASAELIIAAIGAQRVAFVQGTRSVDDASALVTRFSLRALGAAEPAIRAVILRSDEGT